MTLPLAYPSCYRETNLRTSWATVCIQYLATCNGPIINLSSLSTMCCSSMFCNLVLCLILFFPLDILCFLLLLLWEVQEIFPVHFLIHHFIYVLTLFISSPDWRVSLFSFSFFGNSYSLLIALVTWDHLFWKKDGETTAHVMWIVFRFILFSIWEIQANCKKFINLIVFWDFPGWKKVWSTKHNIFILVMSCLSKKSPMALGSKEKKKRWCFRCVSEGRWCELLGKG